MEESDSSASASAPFCKLKEVARESEIDKAREMSLMITNTDQELINKLSQIPCVLDIETHASGRLAFKLSNTETAVTQVISTIMETGGNITSISTKDPSLEDVFMKVTAKKVKKDTEGGD